MGVDCGVLRSVLDTLGIVTIRGAVEALELSVEELVDGALDALVELSVEELVDDSVLLVFVHVGVVESVLLSVLVTVGIVTIRGAVEGLDELADVSTCILVFWLFRGVAFVLLAVDADDGNVTNRSAVEVVV